MSIYTLEGPAGCGKTYQMMERLKLSLQQYPLMDTQRVLALSFMHGSRRRLADRLSQIPELRRKFECVTIDSFAQRVCKRWSALGEYLGLPECDSQDFNQQCANTASLFGDCYVRQWVGISFPIVIIDEAQDLSAERLAIIQKLHEECILIVAADEFQCLVEGLKPNPFVTWAPTVCMPEILTVPRRTNVPALLAAAGNIRNGRAPATALGFSINVTATAPLAAAYVTNAIAWNGGASIALLTPSISGGWASQITDIVATKKNKQGNGPFTFRWERSDTAYVDTILAENPLLESYTVIEAIQFVGSLPGPDGPWASAQNWILKQRNVLGIEVIEGIKIREILVRSVTLHRQWFTNSHTGFRAMTIHQAKNREFDGVIVVWPHTVGGSDDQKRRLLYNAVTRAKRWCQVLVQAEKIKKYPPFS